MELFALKVEKIDMIYFIGLFFPFLSLMAKDFTYQWDNIPFQYINEYLKEGNRKDHQEIEKDLQVAKYLIVTGRPHEAQIILNKIDTASDLRLIQYRYLALTQFITQEKMGENLFQEREFDRTQYYKEICLLKIMNLFKNPHIEQNRIDREIIRCQLALGHSQETFTPAILNQIRQGQTEEIKREFNKKKIEIFQSVKSTLKWMKIFLWMNDNSEFEKYISLIPDQVWNHKNIQELSLFLKYRKDKKITKEDAQDLLHFSNIHNMLATRQLKEKEFDQAFNHLKESLELRPESLNALERMLPLAIYKKDFALALQVLTKIQMLTGQSLFKRVLFQYLQLKSRNEHSQISELYTEHFFLKDDYFDLPPLVLDQQLLFTAIFAQDNDQSFKSTYRTCLKYNELSCWLYQQFSSWRNFNQSMLKIDQVFKNLFEISYNKIKALSTPEIEKLREEKPIDEIRFIDQNYIHELDILDNNSRF